MFDVHIVSSAIFNDIMSGLSGYESTISMSIEQLEDEVVEEYQYILKKYSQQGIVPKKDLFYALNCIELDCKSLDSCCNSSDDYSPAVAHFEIPQIINDFGELAVEYIGSTDKAIKFKTYTGPNYKYHKYKTRGKNKPYVYISTVPNANNLYDGWIFNAPLLERITIIAIFKDPRQVKEYMETHGCCELAENIDNFSWIVTEVKQSLIQKKFQYYRAQFQPAQPNDTAPK